MGFSWVIDLNAIRESHPWLYPFSVAIKNLLGVDELNLIWLFCLSGMMAAIISFDAIFQSTPSTKAHQKINGRAYLQDLLLFYFQVFYGQFIPLSALNISAAYSSQWALSIRDFFGFQFSLSQNYELASVVLMICVFVAQDLARYLSHRSQHRFDWFWELHKFHHSAESLNPFTIFREHPFIFVANALFVVSFSMAATIPIIVLFPVLEGTPVVALGGMVSFVFIKSQVLLSHYHRPISLGFLDRIFVTPAVHAIHHSADPRHFDTNFGTTLTWWDHLFKTYWLPKAEDLESYKPGIEETETKIKGHLFPVKFLFWDLTVQSLQKIFKSR